MIRRRALQLGLAASASLALPQTRIQEARAQEPVPNPAGADGDSVRRRRQQRRARAADRAEARRERLKVLPDIPTAIEAGIPGFVHSTFSVYCTTAGTPAPIVDRLYQTINTTVSDPVFVQTLEHDGVIPVTDSNPQKAAAFIQQSIERLTPILKTMRS